MAHWQLIVNVYLGTTHQQMCCRLCSAPNDQLDVHLNKERLKAEGKESVISCAAHLHSKAATRIPYHAFLQRFLILLSVKMLHHETWQAHDVQILIKLRNHIQIFLHHTWKAITIRIFSQLIATSKRCSQN